MPGGVENLRVECLKLTQTVEWNVPGSDEEVAEGLGQERFYRCGTGEWDFYLPVRVM